MVLVLFHILKTERDDGYGQKTDGIMAAVHTDRAGQRLSAVPRKQNGRRRIENSSKYKEFY